MRAALSIIAIITAFSSSVQALSSINNWPMYGLNPLRTSALPDNATVNDRAEAHRWVLPAVPSSPPVVWNNVLVIGCEDRSIHGIDIKTGARLWTVDTNGFVIASPAVTPEGNAIIAGMDGRVRSVVLSSGRLNWETDTSEPLRGHLLLVDGIV